jgi:hypothetical protein
MTESCSRIGIKDKIWESMDVLRAEEHFKAGLNLGNAARKQYFEEVYDIRDMEAIGCCAGFSWIEI